MPNNNPGTTGNWSDAYANIDANLLPPAPALNPGGVNEVEAIQAPQYGANPANHVAWNWSDAVSNYQMHHYTPHTISVAPVPGANNSLQATLQELEEMTAAQLSAATWKRRKKVDSMNQVMQLITPISEVLGVKPKTKLATEMVVGIEVENEYKTLPPTMTQFPNVSYWQQHSEGSLRYHGFEYVSTPLPGKIVPTAVVDLCKQLKQTGAEPTNSLRTSIHVHYDVTRMSFIEVLTFASLYWVLEGFLSCFAGSHRIGNLFCLRAKDASAVSIALKQVIEQLVLTDCSLLTNDYRYASVNFASLKKFGTLEFRLMRGTLEADEILLWVNAIEQIRQFALKLGTPAKLLEFFMLTPADELPKLVLTEPIYKDLLSYIDEEDIGQLVRESYDAVEDILTAHPDFRFEKETKAWKEDEQKRQEELKRLRELTGTFNDMLIPGIDFGEDDVELAGSELTPLLATVYEVYEGDDV